MTEFYPLGTQEAKAGKVDNAIFVLYSLGLATGRDPYIYPPVIADAQTCGIHERDPATNFSHDACAENAQRMTQDYLAAISELEADPELMVLFIQKLFNYLSN